MNHAGAHGHGAVLLPGLPADWAGAALVFLILAGLASSLHCVGMCGAFAIAASRTRLSRRFGPAGTVLYTLGRLTSYTTVGAVAGAVGQSLWVVAALAGLQSLVALFAGAVLSLAGLRLLGLRPGAGRSADPLAWLLALIGAPLGRLMPPTGPRQAWLLGVLNGLLPCPVVYGFLPAAIAAGSPLAGAAVLGAVGAGTIPAMALAGSIARLAERFRQSQSLAPASSHGLAAVPAAPLRLLVPVAARLPGVLALTLGLFLVGRGAAGLWPVI